MTKLMESFDVHRNTKTLQVTSYNVHHEMKMHHFSTEKLYLTPENGRDERNVVIYLVTFIVWNTFH